MPLGDNTSGTVSGLIIAQRTLEFLHLMFPALTRFTNSFSDERLLFKQSAILLVPLAMTAKAWNKTDGYSPDPADMDEVSVTIDQHDHVSFGFNDQEVTATNRNLIDEQAITSAYALGSRMFNYVFGKITPASVHHENVVANADWNRRSVINQNAYLSARGISPLRRFGIVNSTVFAELCDDIQIVGNEQNPASDAISSGKITNVHGVEIMEWPGMPAAADNNQMTALFGTSQALAVATRLPKDPGEVNPGVPVPGKIETAIDPNTGMSLMVREHYDMRMGYHQVTLTWMYGATMVQEKALERVVKQATGASDTIVDVLV